MSDIPPGNVSIKSGVQCTFERGLRLQRHKNGVNVERSGRQWDAARTKLQYDGRLFSPAASWPFSTGINTFPLDVSSRPAVQTVSTSKLPAEVLIHLIQ